MAATVSVGDLRQALREYERAEAITEREHARRLGVTQQQFNKFMSLGPSERRGMGLGLYAAIYRLHPELRPSLHAAVFGADAVAQTDAGEQVPA